jgi:stearoyl-CoA desaturase (delta-9 desaturase)
MKRRARLMRKTSLIAKFVIGLGTLGALLALATIALKWVHPIHVVLLFIFFVLTEFGITIGFHRLFTHRAFIAHNGLVVVLGILGSMAAQGPILYWASAHRQHHRHSDHDLDPHSPVKRGFWYAQMGWLMDHDLPVRRTIIRDLKHNPMVLWIDRNYLLWYLLGLAIPMLIAGLWDLSWQSALTGLIWGGLFRMFLVHHCTWMVNSICHLFGKRPYDTHDNSRNNALVAILTMGEGWHNNHHAYPRSARHGLLWWQWDPSYYFIWLLQKLKIIHHVRLPGSE